MIKHSLLQKGTKFYNALPIPIKELLYSRKKLTEFSIKKVFLHHKRVLLLSACAFYCMTQPVVDVVACNFSDRCMQNCFVPTIKFMIPNQDGRSSN